MCSFYSNLEDQHIEAKSFCLLWKETIDIVAGQWHRVSSNSTQSMTTNSNPLRLLKSKSKSNPGAGPWVLEVIKATGPLALGLSVTSVTLGPDLTQPNRPCFVPFKTILSCHSLGKLNGN